MCPDTALPFLLSNSFSRVPVVWQGSCEDGTESVGRLRMRLLDLDCNDPGLGSRARAKPHTGQMLRQRGFGGRVQITGPGRWLLKVSKQIQIGHLKRGGITTGGPH